MLRFGWPVASTSRVSPWRVSGTQMSAVSARENPDGPSIDRYGNTKSAGMIPAIVNGIGTLPAVTFRPMTPMSPPNRLCQY